MIGVTFVMELDNLAALLLMLHLAMITILAPLIPVRCWSLPMLVVNTPMFLVMMEMNVRQSIVIPAPLMVVVCTLQ
jgi:hypothetical protein